MLIDYKHVWDVLGYSRCYTRVNATTASDHRKRAALIKAWGRRV